MPSTAPLQPNYRAMRRSSLLQSLCLLSSCLILKCYGFQQLQPLQYSSVSLQQRRSDCNPRVSFNRHHLIWPARIDNEKVSRLFSAISESSNVKHSKLKRLLRSLRMFKFQQLWRFFASMALVVSFFLGQPAIASSSTAAAPPVSNSHITEKVYSIRPGMNQEQAQKLSTGDVDAEELQEQLATRSSLTTTTTESDSKVSSAKQKASSLFGRKGKQAKKKNSLYAGMDDDDLDEEDDEDFMDESDILPPSSQAASQSKGASPYKNTRTQFAGIDNTPNEQAQRVLTAKIATALFIPTFGFLWTREFFRRRREEKYVKKGLEIMEAQRAEYFNVTSTANDADLEDELKGLKNETKTDDDDDDDDEDEPPPPPRGGRPKRPSPRGPSGGEGGRGGAPDAGYNKASSADIDKLKNLFNKS
ncbi:hypothetical protein MPSEU_000748400 [Mayamaea pseudoterrestris]|nr:hypothetical protein MPSEU_000748400 [Mayamaea pseudoterrestris]